LVLGVDTHTRQTKQVGLVVDVIMQEQLVMNQVQQQLVQLQHL
jgi:hypothetical protein